MNRRLAWKLLGIAGFILGAYGFVWGALHLTRGISVVKRREPGRSG